MFKSLKRNWALARASVIRKEVEDAINQIQGLSPEANFSSSGYIVHSINSILKRCGSLDNMSDDGKKAIAKDLTGLARQTFDYNMPKGFAVSLCAAHIEAKALPGEDAKFVETITQRLIDMAYEIDSQKQQDNNSE